MHGGLELGMSLIAYGSSVPLAMGYEFFLFIMLNFASTTEEIN